MVSHVVPEGGVRAWAAPDPSQAAVAELAAGTELRVVEERGQWARVEASNGWSGWVDGARLVAQAAAQVPAQQQPAQPGAGGAPGGAGATAAMQATPPPPPGAPAAAAGGAPRGGVAGSQAPARAGLAIGQVLALVGALVAAISTLLSWFDFGGQSENAFEPAAEFLWDHTTSETGGFSIGILLVVLAVVVGLLALVRRAGVVRRVVAAVALAVPVLFAVQFQRALDELGDFPGQPGVFDALGLGVYVAAAGAAVALLAPSGR